MVETMAPGFVTPQRGVQIPAVVSIVGTGRPLSEGIQLHHNRDKFGFFLNKEIEGFGLAPFENTTQARASGGATLRNRRTAEGSMFLPLTLVSPNPSSMYDMMAWLVDTVTGQDGFFDVVFFDPYSQEARRRTVLYDSGLETVNEQIPDFKHVVGVTGTFLSPFWRGPERVVTEGIAPPVKPLITADPGSPVNRWDDPGFGDSTAYEPWFVVDGGLEKQGTGADHGRFVAGHRISVNPGETVSVSADLSYVDGPNVGDIQVRVRAYDSDGALVSGSEQTVISESYGGSYTGTYVVPEAGVEVELGFYTASDVHANTRVRIENLDVKREVQYLAQYEWEGEPHASPSVKRVGDEIVARNLVLDPSFENGLTYWYPASVIVGNVDVVPTDGDLWAGIKSNAVSVHVPADRTANNDVDFGNMDVEVGQWVAISAYVAQAGDQGTFQYQYRIRSSNGTWSYPGVPITDIEDGTRFTTVAQVPEAADAGFMNLRASFRDQSANENTMYATHFMVAVADTEGEALSQVEPYFDGGTPDVVDEGSREGSYSFPFFPVFLADSTVQGEHDLTVEGDAPVWPVWEIVGPGKDVEIIGPDGSRLFVEGEVSTPITIVTEPGKRSIRDASGLIWERMKPGDDQFFPLEPGEQVVKMTMVGGNPESTIKAVYSENWKTPRGTAQGMIRGDVA